MDLLRRSYYGVKPFLPWRLRLALKRKVARVLRRRSTATWPIDEAAGTSPVGWTGWPEGKQFAFVLTHDIEGQSGLDKVRAVAELEMSLGFRSSFNFVPEGGYTVPKDLRDWLTNNGFEVGVHDLRHDGSLFNSRAQFQKSADRINHYLKEWGACGFRAGFMLHEIEWFQDLDISYDSSTFDTDPFEPQPDGVQTIFPFRVVGAGNKSYIELPYTLPQDSTMFLTLQEPGIAIWERKLDWIVSKGGMVLLNTHPDYMALGDEHAREEYPLDHYRQFLETVRNRYADHAWCALPRDVAAFAVSRVKTEAAVASSSRTKAGDARGKRIWIDLDNTPHVPFFEPIIPELKRRGYEVLLTARDAYQVCEMAHLKEMHPTRIGKHYGKNSFWKVAGTVFRALQLLTWTFKNRPDAGLSHGSRAQIFICNLLGLPSILVMDYEHAKTLPMMRPRWEIFPEVVPSDKACVPLERVRHYPGIKEDVYASYLKPSPLALNGFSVEADEVLITVRPPATEAHYHNPESEALFSEFMKRAVKERKAKVVLLPRNKRQREWIEQNWPEWLSCGRVVIPDHALDGMNLLWHSDLVVSGGGTMNREATALEVPVYSIFRGPIGAVDRHLVSAGRLILIETPEHVHTRIRIEKRIRRGSQDHAEAPALKSILAHVENILGP